MIKQTEIVSLSVLKMNLDDKEKGKNDLETDSVVQRKNIEHLAGRELQNASHWLGEDTSTKLEAKSIGKWNQFEANKKLFNVKRYVCIDDSKKGTSKFCLLLLRIQFLI